MTLHVGLALPTAPELTLAELARTAEQLRYAHLWVSDHVLLPSRSNVPADHQLDPFASLAWWRRRLGELISARACSWFLSRGRRNRESFGHDRLAQRRAPDRRRAGWLRPEFAALGVPFVERARRTDEAIRALRDLWAAAAS